MKKIICSFWLLLLVLNTYANVKPNNVFSNNMVLQRNAKVTVWGTADEGEKVTVAFGGQKVSTIAKKGKWMLLLQPMSANNKPQTLLVEGKNKVTFKNVLVGEVWFCSGQSNMEMFVGKYRMYRGVKNYEDELKDVHYPSIRLLQIPHYSSGLPLPETNCTWMNVDSATVYWTSAVAWFFAKKMNLELHVPVGLIVSAWGGSPIQVWTPSSVFKESNDFEKEKQKLDLGDNEYNKSIHPTKEEWEKQLTSVMDTLSIEMPSEKWISKPLLPLSSGNKLSYPNPSSLFNGMVSPIIPYSIHGVLWYQGESNLGDGLFYTKRMEAMVKSWRREWGEGDFPFYYVKIAPFTYKDWPVKNATPDMLPKLWEAQKAALSIPNVSMVSTDDLGELDDIHPIRKKEIGERLAELMIKSLIK